MRSAPDGDVRGSGGLRASSSSGEVSEFGVVAVIVAPVDVAGDQPGLGLVVGVVGAGEAEVAQPFELGLDPVQPGGVVGRVGELDQLAAAHSRIVSPLCGEKLSSTSASLSSGG